jgi:hypothetical protein
LVVAFGFFERQLINSKNVIKLGGFMKEKWESSTVKILEEPTDTEATES